jgi:hypothetical protein
VGKRPVRVAHSYIALTIQCKVWCAILMVVSIHISLNDMMMSFNLTLLPIFNELICNSSLNIHVFFHSILTHNTSKIK